MSLENWMVPVDGQEGAEPAGPARVSSSAGLDDSGYPYDLGNLHVTKHKKIIGNTRSLVRNLQRSGFFLDIWEWT